jgi:hypothetical protein
MREHLSRIAIGRKKSAFGTDSLTGNGININTWRLRQPSDDRITHAACALQGLGGVPSLLAA